MTRRVPSINSNVRIVSDNFSYKLHYPDIAAAARRFVYNANVETYTLERRSLSLAPGIIKSQIARDVINESTLRHYAYIHIYVVTCLLPAIDSRQR